MQSTNQPHAPFEDFQPLQAAITGQDLLELTTSADDPPDIEAGLTEIEARRWRLLRAYDRIDIVAAIEKTSRAAIYASIRGNSRGQGGMTKKNKHVRVWWRKRRTRGRDDG